MRRRVHEVKDLRHQKQQQRLAEMSQDPDDREHHPREIAIRVPHEHPRRVPIVPPQRHGDPDEGEQEVQREQMRIRRRVQVRRQEVQDVIQRQQRRDHEALRDLDPVDAREDVDAVGAEDGHGGHVDVVQQAEVEEPLVVVEVRLQEPREHDGRHAEVDEVDD